MLETLKDKIDHRNARVAIIGLGYVGFPVAVAFSENQFPVTGLDVSTSKVKHLNAGRSDVADIKDERLHAALSSGFLSITSQYEALAESDVIIICVPTPLSKTKDPDMTFIVAAVEGLKPHLRKGQLVILESTTYPGTTDELILPILHDTGLVVGQDFSLAFSPERIDPGNKEYTFETIPKIVGGITPLCTELAVHLYQQIVTRVIPVSTTRTAEMVKILENTFRSVNIGLVNEIALICDKLEINVWETIEAASSKPFGFLPFFPGPGLGGHCIPIDPHYLSWKLKTLDYPARFISLASEINANMPYYVVSKILDTLNQDQKSANGSRILILGVAYKPDINDERESPAFDVIELLENKMATVDYHDPFIPEITISNKQVSSITLTDEALAAYDCVTIITDHSTYDIAYIVNHSQRVVDTRNATKGLDNSHGKIIKL